MLSVKLTLKSKRMNNRARDAKAVAWSQQQAVADRMSRILPLFPDPDDETVTSEGADIDDDIHEFVNDLECESDSDPV